MPYDSPDDDAGCLIWCAITVVVIVSGIIYALM